MRLIEEEIAEWRRSYIHLFPYPIEDWVSLTDKVSRMALTNEFPYPLEDFWGSNKVGLCMYLYQ